MIAGTVERTIDAQERRSAGLDQRGGVLLGLAGVLVGVVLRDPNRLNYIELAAAFIAALAALFAGLTIVPRVSNAVDPADLLELYAEHPAEDTQFALLSTLAALYRDDGHRVTKKANLLRSATGLLFLAVVLVTIGATLKAGLL